MSIRRKLINVKTSFQPNRILIHKPTRIGLIVPEEVVMQLRLAVAILVLQSEGLVSSSSGCVGFALQFASAVIIAEPNQVAVLIGHLSRDTDLVAVEVVGLLTAFAVCGCPIAYLCQGFIAVWIGVDIGISAVRLDFLQEVAAVPNEAGFLFEAV